jgi:hypothetical protein
VTVRISSSPQQYDAQVMSAIADAARATGADFGFLLSTAQRESGFDPRARSQSSSATGLFQFTAETWLRMIDRYGARHGLANEAAQVRIEGGRATTDSAAERQSLLALREDPALSAKMAGELARENASILRRKIGRMPTQPELYAAHFLGPSGAARLIEAARSGAGGDATRLFPAAARANVRIFHDDAGNPITPRALYARLTGDEQPGAPSPQGDVAPPPPPEPAKLRGRQAVPDLLIARAQTPPQAAENPQRFGAGLLSSDMISALFRLDSPDRSSGDSA